MKIHSLEISDYEPIKHLKLDNLGNTVIIAGANGSGKTRLKQAIVQTIQGSPLMDMTISATRDEEKEPKNFGGDNLILKKGAGNGALNTYINSRKYGSGRFVGSLVQIDSSRNIETVVKYTPVNWLGGDPDDTETPSNFYFNLFKDRWKDFIDYIHQKAASRDKKIADALKKSPKDGEKIIKDHPDPLEKYKEIFAALLPGKILLDIDPAHPNQFHFNNASGLKLPFASLSSGEQEVIKVLFDVARKEIKHSVIIVDEPELHLHPTLTYKLIEALKAIGDHTNQFIFLTHSADLISTYYSTGDVYFIDAVQTGANQAHKLSELNHSHKHVVNLINQNLGLFAVGKKLVFVEGKDSSIDRLTYHAIGQKIIPDAKIIPAGSVSTITALHIVEEQIKNSIFGIDLFMIRDRDGFSEAQISEIEKSGRIKCLKKRHIENYFLDVEVLFKVAEKLYLTTIHKNLSEKFIDDGMKKIAQESINYNLLQNTKDFLSLNHSFTIPNVKDIESKTPDVIKNELLIEVTASIGKLSSDLSEPLFRAWLDAEEARLRGLLNTLDWKDEFQGKYIFSKLCSTILKDDHLKIRHAYVDIALAEKREVFSDIITIFEGFK